MAYTKLASSILTSTIWMEDDHTRLVWLTMLAMADRNGDVQASIPGLANIARVPVEGCRSAIEKFMSPDGDSRTSDDEGRRIEKIEGGWHLLNHGKYRDLLSGEDRRRKAAERQQRSRDRRKRNNENQETSRKCVTRCDKSRQICQAEAEAEAEAKKRIQNTCAEPPMAAAVCAAPESSSLNPADILIAWNRCHGLVPANRITAKRKAAIAARSKDAEWAAQWEAAIVKVASSDFCCGGGSTGWRADIDWFLKPDTLTKVIEGKYDNSQNTNGRGQPDIFQSLREYSSGRDHNDGP